VKFIIQI